MRNLLSIALIVSMVLGITAFECASKEMTSAKMYINQKKPEKAIEMLHAELDKNSQNAEAYYLLGRLQGEKDDFEKAIKNFEKSLEISKKFEKNIKEDKFYYWAQSYNKGINALNSATKATTDSEINEAYAKAEDFLNSAMLLQPDSLATYDIMVDLYLYQQKLDQAINPLETIIEKTGDGDAYSKLGAIYIEQKKFDKALEVLEEGNLKNPGNNDILTALSQLYITTGRIDTAIKSISEIVKKDPENKFMRYTLGTLLYNDKQLDKAQEQLEKALELDPEYLDALNNIAAVHVSKGIEARKTIEADENDSKEYEKEFEKALDYLQRYIEIEPNIATAWESLGTVYANLGNTEKSSEAFRKADELKSAE